MRAAVVTTRSGAVRGAFDHEVVAFRGIPYAAPPVGPRRFMAPALPDPWGEMRDASTFSPIPSQLNPASRRLPTLDLGPLFPEPVPPGDGYLHCQRLDP